MVWRNLIYQNNSTERSAGVNLELFYQKNEHGLIIYKYLKMKHRYLQSMIS